MFPIRSVTVYCSSSTAIPRAYFDAGAELGRSIAGQKWSLVYGGNFVGLMAAVAQAARDGGAKVIGVTPQLMVDKGISDTRADELIVTNTMRDRKAIMEERGDAFIALPGGLGTFEEVFEIIVARQLQYHDKPIVLLNISNYFGALLEMIEHGIEQKFIKAKARELYYVTPDVADAIRYLQSYVPRPGLKKRFGELSAGELPSGAE